MLSRRRTSRIWRRRSTRRNAAACRNASKKRSGSLKRRSSPSSARSSAGSSNGFGEPAPGEPKRVFRDSAVENLSEFFSRFKELSVRDNDELDRLVEQARNAVRGVAPQELRDSGALRQRIVHDLGQVQQSLDALMVERPRRRILRPNAAASAVA